jgi:glucoamylase
MPKICVVAAITMLAFCGQAQAVSGTAPGAPGENAIWTPANKSGYGTATTTTSKVWHTLQDGKLTEVYYPDLGTPSVRDLQFIVSDGKTFAVRESDSTKAIRPPSRSSSPTPAA